MKESPVVEVPKKNPRRFLPEDLTFDSWEKLEPYFVDLRDREIRSAQDLEGWLKDRSELEAVISEEGGWRYIRMSIDTGDEKLLNDYTFFIQEIQPKMAPYEDAFNRKLIESPFLKDLDKEKYRIYIREVKQALELYREENIPLFTEIRTTAQKFGAITGAQTIEYNGKELTMQQAAKYLKDDDRKVREEVFRKMAERRLEDREKLDELFSKLVGLRHKVALNAGFDNYRDFKFAELGRFDYSVEDCLDFHDSIEKEIVPLVRQFRLDRKEKLGYDKLRPWDGEVDPEGKPALKPFKDGKELISRTIDLFRKVHPYFGERLDIMNRMGHLDLESKSGKMPGGYNYPLYEIGVPFIFMNAVGTQGDLVTMIHEGGHAVHSFLTRDLELTSFKSFPSEVAELASMSMELITMDRWDIVYDDEDELRRAKVDQLERLLLILPWIATIDRFQHWIYENPEHTAEERTAAWKEIQERFSAGVTDWSGLEEAKESIWQRQLHLFEVPFYYIEYGMAQLGAIAIWKNYEEKAEDALEAYMQGLQLGYTKSIPEIYETAGIKFNFSRDYVKELASFVAEKHGELSK